MSGTIEAVSTLLGEQQDNTSGAIHEGNMRNLTESAFSIVVSPNGVKTASYTAALTDRGTVVPFNASSGSANYTIPPNASIALPVGAVLGALWVAGATVQPAFVAGSGVTVNTASTLTLRAAGSIAWAWQYSANIWYVFGDLT